MQCIQPLSGKSSPLLATRQMQKYRVNSDPDSGISEREKVKSAHIHFKTQGCFGFNFIDAKTLRVSLPELGDKGP